MNDLGLVAVAKGKGLNFFECAGCRHRYCLNQAKISICPASKGFGKIAWKEFQETVKFTKWRLDGTFKRAGIIVRPNSDPAAAVQRLRERRARGSKH